MRQASWLWRQRFFEMIVRWLTHRLKGDSGGFACISREGRRAACVAGKDCTNSPKPEADAGRCIEKRRSPAHDRPNVPTVEAAQPLWASDVVSGAGALSMVEGEIAPQCEAPAVCFDFSAPVEIFAIKEEGGIKRSDCFDDLAAKAQARAGEPIDLDRMANPRRNAERPVCSEAQHVREAQKMHKSSESVWAEAGIHRLCAAVWPQKPGSHRPNVRMGLEMIDQRVKQLGRRPSVRVQKQPEASVETLEREVYASRKADVVWTADHRDCLECRSHGVGRTIGRGVIDDHDPRSCGTTGQDFGQALKKPLAGVVRDQDDREVVRVSRHRTLVWVLVPGRCIACARLGYDALLPPRQPRTARSPSECP